MRIGIDLDDTIFSTSEQYRKYQKEFTDYSSYYIKEIDKKFIENKDVPKYFDVEMKSKIPLSTMI